jgi:hypothetical protein
MGDYFKPRRRKIGVVTLVLACVFAAGWVRSEATYDFVTLNLGDSVYKVGSFSGITRLIRETAHGKASEEQPRKQPTSKRRSNTNQLLRWNSGLASSIIGPKVGWDTGYEVQWNWKCGDFSCGSATRGIGRFEATTVPYWAIIIPLALLATYLLLSKPQEKKSAIEQQASA